MAASTTAHDGVPMAHAARAARAPREICLANAIRSARSPDVLHMIALTVLSPSTATGYCGATVDHCACADCIDYRPQWTDPTGTDAGTCGANVVGMNGQSPAWCNPNSDGPCCSEWGYCGASDAHCGCEKCVDNRLAQTTDDGNPAKAGIALRFTADPCAVDQIDRVSAQLGKLLGRSPANATMPIAKLDIGPLGDAATDLSARIVHCASAALH
eukprot:1008591-Prymnesium_polylepis.1